MVPLIFCYKIDINDIEISKYMKIINGNCKLMEKIYTPRWRFFAKMHLVWIIFASQDAELLCSLKIMSWNKNVTIYLIIRTNYLYDIIY